jgi:ABC-type Mn2+/Zn2+ transport system ATPase subunit
LAFVPQRCDLSPALPVTVREFVDLGLVGIRLPRISRRERVASALERVGFEGVERKDYWALSGGQRQRVLVARALVRRPVFLVLDEPTTNLDLDAEETFLRSIDDLNREEGVTILFVTHRVRIAPEHSTHVALFGGGRVQAGPSSQILTPLALAGTFGISEEAASRLVPESTRRSRDGR